MTTASQQLAEWAAGLTWERIPPEVIERAKDCIIDTVGACVFGSRLPWTQRVIEYAKRNSAPGECSVLGTPIKVRAPFACLANGAAAHAYELDALCEPSVGIHPSAALAVPALASAQGRRLGGREFLTAFVAGYEVLYRIGDAAHHSIEKVGFHSPGVVGVFGTAVVAGRLLELDARRLAHALGIAASMSSGLMEFSRSGGMVKRLHLGRAAEGGFMAAALARDGYTGPEAALEGPFGFLKVFCRDARPERLTQDFDRTWHVMKTKVKRYACHSTAQVPVTLALELKAKHGVRGEDVAEVAIAANEKTVTQHNIPEPRDLTMMQYSVPFCVALALYLDPTDPQAFSEISLDDPRIRGLSARTKVERLAASGDYLSPACRVTLRLRDGRAYSAEGHDFKGTPMMPLTRDELLEKFLKLTAHCDPGKARGLFEQLAAAEQVRDFSALDFTL